MEHLSLLAGGEEHTRAEWEKAAADVLRKSGRMTADDPDARVWEKLTRTTLDGVEIPPLGIRDALEGLPPTGEPGAAPYTRGTALSRPDEGWDVRTHLADPDAKRAAADALTDLENGATSLWLSLGHGGIAVEDLPTVLDEVHVNLAPVALDCPDDPVGAAEAFCALLDDRGVTPASGTSLAVDPGSATVRGYDRDVASDVARLVELARQHGTLAFTVDATVVHDHGGHDAHELGAALAAGAHYLRLMTDDLGLTVEDAAALIDFRYAVSDEQLLSIAKLRAARRTWARLLELSGAPDAPGQVQHAVTSRAMLTKHDPWVNMLRGTVAAFAAGVGGASSVTVLPFDEALGIPDALGRRVARNTSSLLIHESHVARVTDPAGGSYAVEQLTDSLARRGWEELQRLEADGGIFTSLDTDGGFSDRIRDEAVRPRQELVATRRRGLTGVSEFPHLHEDLPERRPHPEGHRTADRWSLPFEALRDDPATTPVFLATLGPVAQHTARATFAANLLASGGVDTTSAGPTRTTEDVVKAFTNADPRTGVVCLAGTDAAYAEWGADVVAELREAGATYVVLAGKPGEKTLDESLVDDHCAVGIDALAFLHRVREELSR
jgi:methylmalonyl-CoA mutase